MRAAPEPSSTHQGADPDPPGQPAFPDAVRHKAHQLALVYAAGVVALLPWIVWLALSLPRRNLDLHYNLAWVGFDCMLLLAMARTAYLAFRLDARLEIPATVTATLLVIDAWFDVTTSGSRADFLESLALAVFLELPVAALSLYVAHRAHVRLAERSGVGTPEPLSGRRARDTGSEW